MHRPMTAPRPVGELLAEMTSRLSAAGVPTPAVDAELLLRHVTSRSRTWLLIDGRVDDEVVRRLEPLVRRREDREPLQLIVGSVGFRYIDVVVREGVFIPRPETEVLAGEAIRRARPGAIVVEPCTGTGAVACAVALEARPARTIATDRSAAAVELARLNADRLGAAVEVLNCDLLQGMPDGLRGRVDVLVANPPYLTPEDLQDREPEVAQWDPPAALVAGETGHEVSDRLIDAAGSWLRPGGWLLLEVDSARAAETAHRAGAGGLRDAEVVSDLTGAERIVAARRP